jgi:hypothetical protein
MLVYTSVTKSYLPKARVLAKSIKCFHPDWIFVLLFSDDMPISFDLKQEPFDEILTIEQLGLPNLKRWVFGHSIVELCTAVKGIAAESLAQRSGIDKIMYLDPDIKVFNSLTPLETLLDQYDILLTPHMLDLEEDIDAIRDNEISALKHGVYNLGFFAATTSGQGIDFIRWWAKRLRFFCHDDIPGGLFTDQRWCDLAPAFFSKLFIVRDRGYNVATWNIAHRCISKDKNGVFFAAKEPLRFYHFTGYDSGDGYGMLLRYVSDQSTAYELWDTYGNDLVTEGQGNSDYNGWCFERFENDELIPTEARRLYRARLDLQHAFPEPFSVVEPCFLSWWKAEIVLGKTTDKDSSSVYKIVRTNMLRKAHKLLGYRIYFVNLVMKILRSKIFLS